MTNARLKPMFYCALIDNSSIRRHTHDTPFPTYRYVPVPVPVLDLAQEAKDRDRQGWRPAAASNHDKTGFPMMSTLYSTVYCTRFTTTSFCRLPVLHHLRDFGLCYSIFYNLVLVVQR